MGQAKQRGTYEQRVAAAPPRKPKIGAEEMRRLVWEAGLEAMGRVLEQSGLGAAMERTQSRKREALEISGWLAANTQPIEPPNVEVTGLARLFAQGPC